jgi:hypothetical protein
MRLWPLAVLGLTLAFAPAAGAQEPPRGQSRDLPLSFQTQGGAAWCGPRVAVRLTSSSPATFRTTVALQRFTGGVRGILEQDCPQMLRVVYEGFARNQRVFLAETHRRGRWRLVDLEENGEKPKCDLGDPDCDRRAEAYSLASVLFNRPGWDGLTYEDFMDLRPLPERAGYHLSWSQGAVTGFLTLIDAVEGDAREAVRRMTRETAVACETGGGRFGIGDVMRDTRQVSARSTTCAGGANPMLYHHVVWSDGFRLYLVTASGAFEAGGAVQATSQRLIAFAAQ